MYLLSTIYWFNLYFSNSPSTEIPILSPDSSGGSNSGDENISKIIFKSLISLVSLRELNYKGEQIKLYTFDKWIFTPLDNYKNLYETSIDVNNTITNISATIVEPGLIKVLL